MIYQILFASSSLPYAFVSSEYYRLTSHPTFHPPSKLTLSSFRDRWSDFRTPSKYFGFFWFRRVGWVVVLSAAEKPWERLRPNWLRGTYSFDNDSSGLLKEPWMKHKDNSLPVECTEEKLGKTELWWTTGDSPTVWIRQFAYSVCMLNPFLISTCCLSFELWYTCCSVWCLNRCILSFVTILSRDHHHHRSNHLNAIHDSFVQKLFDEEQDPWWMKLDFRNLKA